MKFHEIKLLSYSFQFKTILAESSLFIKTSYIFMKFQQKQTYVNTYNDQISDYNVLERYLSHFHEMSRNSTALIFISHSKLCSLNFHSIYKDYSHFHETLYNSPTNKYKNTC